MRAILATAFLEGACVLVVEIAGARALAPYFGASLRVWTAQITATLLFLALGYGAGGLLCRRGPLALSAVLWAAGGWLALYPVWRTLTLQWLMPLGVSAGAFAASAWLFGPPLTCLGAVSPLLVQRLGVLGMEGGQAAGRLFFTNTLGGLAGGWITALVLVPHVPLRVVLAGCGLTLAALGALWARTRVRTALTWLCVLAGLGAVAAARKPARALRPLGWDGPAVHIVQRVQSGSGLIQVIELPGVFRSLLVNGVAQGSLDLATGASFEPFSDYLAFVAHRYHPRPKRALLLGLGCGVLGRTLHGMGLEVTAVEIEPEIAELAREHFGLPAGVRVVVEDARAFLARDRGHYDVVILDAYAGESTAWYLLTREGLVDAKQRLAPGGRMVVNTVTKASGQSPGLVRLEAGLLAAFGEARVFIEPRLSIEQDDLVNATLVAGSGLSPNDTPYPATPSERVAPFLGDLNATPLRPARRSHAIDTDELSALDVVEADLRVSWRNQVVTRFGADVLQD